MKLMAKCGKSLWAQGLACLVLLIGQVLCVLSLPAMMGHLVTVGVQQGGIETGAPEAMSGRGMEILRLYMDGENRQLMDQAYLWVEPGSSEAQRVTERYPLAREADLCVLRGDLDRETREQADRAYAQAAHGFLLGLQEARESGELSRLMRALEAEREAARKQREEAARQRQEESSAPESEPEESEVEFGAYLRVPSKEQDFLPEGVLGAIPDDALFTLPEGFVPGPEKDGELSSQPEEGAEASESGGESAAIAGLSKMSIRQFYALGALLAQTPKSSREETAAAVRESDPLLGEQTGAALKSMFYWELGMDVESIRSACLWGMGWKMLGIVLLGAAAAVSAALLSARASAGAGRELRRQVFFQTGSAPPSGGIAEDIRRVQELVDRGLPAVCRAFLLGIGAALLAAGKSAFAAWSLAVLTAVLMGLTAGALKLVLPKRETLGKWTRRLRTTCREQLSGLTVLRAFGREEAEKERFGEVNRGLADAARAFRCGSSLWMPALLLVMNLACLVILWAGGGGIAASALQLGDVLAFVQYAVLIDMAFFMAVGPLVKISGAKASLRRLQEALEVPVREESRAEDKDSGKEGLS